MFPSPVIVPPPSRRVGPPAVTAQPFDGLPIPVGPPELQEPAWRAVRAATPVLDNVSLWLADLSQRYLDRDELQSVNLESATLGPETFVRVVRAAAVAFDESRGTAIGFSGMRITTGSFRSVDYAAPDFRDAELRCCDFTGARMVEADFARVQAGGTRRHPDRRGIGLRFPSYFCDAYLPGFRAHDADLSEADFSRADLTEAIFTGASLARARLTGANLTGARFHGTDLRGADLRDTVGLTAGQLRLAEVDETTKLPPEYATARVIDLRSAPAAIAKLSR